MKVTDQASGTEATTNQGGTQAAAPTTAASTAPASTSSDDLSALRTRLERTEAELEKTRKEAAGRRVAANKAAEENGEYKALAENLKARVAELEPLEPLAKRWAAHEQRELERLNAARAGLPPEAQAALDAVPTLEGKQAILNLLGSKGGPAQRPPPEKPPIPGGAPPPPNGTDWTSFSTSAELEAAKQRDPAGWKTYLESQGGTSRSLTFIERMQQRASKQAGSS